MMKSAQEQEFVPTKVHAARTLQRLRPIQVHVVSGVDGPLCSSCISSFFGLESLYALGLEIEAYHAHFLFVITVDYRGQNGSMGKTARNTRTRDFAGFVNYT